jgi:hypothetical protein
MRVARGADCRARRFEAMRVARAADRVNTVQQRVARAQAAEDTHILHVNGRAAHATAVHAL